MELRPPAAAAGSVRTSTYTVAGHEKGKETREEHCMLLAIFCEH
jgi:hypothetical protein